MQAVFISRKNKALNRDRKEKAEIVYLFQYW